MTLNDLEPPKYGFSEFFAIAGRDAYLEQIFAEITGHRPRQPAYEMFWYTHGTWAIFPQLREISLTIDLDASH